MTTQRENRWHLSSPIVVVVEDASVDPLPLVVIAAEVTDKVNLTNVCNIRGDVKRVADRLHRRLRRVEVRARGTVPPAIVAEAARILDDAGTEVELAGAVRSHQ